MLQTGIIMAAAPLVVGPQDGEGEQERVECVSPTRMQVREENATTTATCLVCHVLGNSESAAAANKSWDSGIGRLNRENKRMPCCGGESER